MPTKIAARELPPEEWDRLRAFPPFDVEGLPTPDHWRFVVCEVDDEVAAFCGLFETVHADPWHVVPAYQGHPAVMRALLRTWLQVLGDYNVHLVHTTVPTNREDIATMLETVGYRAAPGRLYLLYVPDALEV